MKTFWLIEENAGVCVNVDGSQVSARLYVNVRNGTHNATATLTHWRGKTEAGARTWAAKELTRHNGGVVRS